MKFVIGALLLAGVLLVSTGPSQAQSSSMWPWNWGMSECKSGYKYDSKRNVCVAEKKKKGKKKVAKKSKGKKKKSA